MCIRDRRKKAIALDAIVSVKRPEYRQEDVEIHSDFHRELALHCGSDAIVQELDRVWFRHIMLYSSVNAAMYPVPPDWHQRLLTAILSGDPDRADTAMREHIAFGKEHLGTVLKKIENLASSE